MRGFILTCAPKEGPVTPESLVLFPVLAEDETEALSVNGNKTHEVVGIQSLELLRLQVKLIEDFAQKKGITL